MNIIVPCTGPVPDKNSVSYLIKVAKKLKARLVVLRILVKDEKESGGKQSLDFFIEMGKQAHVPVSRLIRRGNITQMIIEAAAETSADLIILGLSRGAIVAEWLNAKAMENTDIPVLILPKWVPYSNNTPTISMGGDHNS